MEDEHIYSLQLIGGKGVIKMKHKMLLATENV